MTRNIQAEEERKEKFYQERGYPPAFEYNVAWLITHEKVSEEGMQELWSWYSKELDREVE